MGRCRQLLRNFDIIDTRLTFCEAPISFEGPCYNNQAPQIEMRGLLEGPSSLSAIPKPSWILFQDLRGLAFTGSGGAAVLDGHGEAALDRHHLWRKGQT
ncbi:hypothetical protein Nepgr_021897 [Nepenthes gracilis]|uniref:Uncharacterized protein n=1 Tax=Nepenthes gracilis TaxID=150966 RepID=A0AAD3XXU7_NEPGR|nr:hypothetical protein Nepgr_021897 [Nepenthes gracilis]